MFGFNDKRFTDNLVKNLLVNKKKIPLTSGNQKRNFIYIEDLLISINSIIMKSYKIKKITYIDLKSKNELTIKKFVTLIISELHNKTNKNFNNRLLWNVLKKRLYENNKPTLNNNNTLRLKLDNYQTIEKSIKLLISHYVK
jgi:dTDP-D-glucose 4,6-dehydratase